MESNGHRDWAREQLHEIERAELASWVAHPPTPAWWAVGFGLWAATLALVAGLLDGAARSICQLVLVLVMLGVIAWDRRRRGTYPSGLPPRALAGTILRMVLGAVAVACVAWRVGASVGVEPAAAVAGVGAWAVVAWYEREYAAVAGRIREQLR